MDRFFDLQLFGTSEMNIMNPGDSSNPVSVNGSTDTASNLSNISSDYVVITGGSAGDIITSTASSHVTVNSADGADTITASSATEDLIINAGGGADLVNLVGSSGAEVYGGAGTDTVNVTNSSGVTVDGGDDGDEVKVVNSDKVVVSTGAGDDVITVATETIGSSSSNVTIDAGTGSNTINISADSKNITFSGLTDSDIIVLDGLTAMPRFATFNDEGVLNVDGVKFNLDGVEVSKDSKVKIKVGEDIKELGDLLKEAPPYWRATLSGNKKSLTGVLTYYSAEGVALATVTGLNKNAVIAAAAEAGLDYDNSDKKTYAVDHELVNFPGLTVDANNNIIVSSSLLPASGTVSLAVTPEGKDFNFALEDDEVEFTATGLAVTAKKVATYTSKAKSNGYYVGDDGKKIKFIKANAVATAFTIGNLAVGTTTLAASASNTLAGVDFEITGNTGNVTISDSSKFSTVKGGGKGVSVGGEDVTFNITDENFASINGSATDDHIIFSGGADSVTTITAAAGNDWITDNGVKDKIDLGAGNDFMLGNYSSNTVLAGAGNDYVYVAGDSNTVHGAAGDDTLEVAGGESNTVNADAGNDIILVNNTTATVTGSTILAAAGNDSIAVVGGYEETTTDEATSEETTKTVYTFTKSKIDAGAGNDYLNIDTASGVVVDAGAGNDTVDLKDFVGGTVSLGAGIDIVSLSGVVDSEIDLGLGNNLLDIKNASSTNVIGGANIDTLQVVDGVASDITFESGAGNDIAKISVSTLSGSAFDFGAGNDNVSIIGGEGTDNFIDMGIGNDIVMVSETGITNSTIDTGFGNDVISIFGGSADPGTEDDTDADADSDAGDGELTASDNSNEDELADSDAENAGEEETSTSNVYYYGYGDGNDTIYGFTENDKLVIGDSNFTAANASTGTVKIGDAERPYMRITVGEGSAKGTITLMDVADKSLINGVNIVGSNVAEAQLEWTVLNGTATGKLNGVAVATISNLKKAVASTAEGALSVAEQNKAIAAAITDDGNKIIIGAAALDSTTAANSKTPVTFKTNKGGYVLTLGKDVTQHNTTPNGWEISDVDEKGRKTATCKGTTEDSGFKASDDGKTISYIAADPTKNYMPIVKGLGSNVEAADLSLNGTTVILSAGALPDMSTANEDSEDLGITVKNGDAEREVTFALGLDTLSAEGEGKVTIAKTGTADWNTTTEETDEGLTTAASYISAFTDPGYCLTDDGKVGYKVKQGATTLVTVRGLKVGTQSSDLAVAPDGTTITVAKNALNSAKTTIYIDEYDDDGEHIEGVDKYKLALGKGITAAKLTNAGWKVSGTTAYYQTRKITKNGYAVSDDGKSIDYYDNDNGDNTVLTLTGVKAGSAKFLNYATDYDSENEKTVVTVTAKAGALNKTDVALEVNENYQDEKTEYKLVLGDDVKTPTVEHDAGWFTVSGGKSVNYLAAKNTEGYELGGYYGDIDNEGKSEFYPDNTINYVAASGGAVQLSITGLKGITTQEKVTSLVSKDGENAGIYVLDFASGDLNSTVAGNGVSVSSASSTYYVDEDENKSTRYGFKLKKAGELHNGSSVGISLIGSTGVDSLYGGAGKDSLQGGDGNDVLSGLAGNDYIEGGDGDDTLLGGNGNDKLYGGAGKNSILGGNGNDTLFAGDANAATTGENTLTGGVGKDLFYHLGGKTTITDYAAGADTIQVADVTGIANKVSVDGSDVIFTFEEGNSITVKNGKNKILAVAAGSETVKKKYTVSATAGSDPLVEEVWFDDDNELISADSLSNITEIEVIGGELESSQPEKLTQENLVTYGG